MDYIENTTCKLCGFSTSEAAILFKLNEKQSLLKCPNCGLMFNDRFCSDLSLVYGKDYYSANSKPQAGGYFDYEALEESLNNNYDFAYESIITDLSKPGASANILDIGCGYGFFLKRFLDFKNAELSCIEVSRVAADHAGKVIADVYLTSIERFESDTLYTHMAAFELMEHVFDPASFLRKANSLLVDNGKLFLTMPNAGSAWFSLMRKRWPATQPESHNYYYTPKTLALFLKKHGFKIEKMTRRQTLHKTIFQLRKRMAQIFPRTTDVLSLLKGYDRLTIPFLSGGSLEVICTKEGGS